MSRSSRSSFRADMSQFVKPPKYRVVKTKTVERLTPDVIRAAGLRPRDVLPYGIREVTVMPVYAKRRANTASICPSRSSGYLAPAVKKSTSSHRLPRAEHNFSDDGSRSARRSRSVGMSGSHTTMVSPSCLSQVSDMSNMTAVYDFNHVVIGFVRRRNESHDRHQNEVDKAKNVTTWLDYSRKYMQDHAGSMVSSRTTPTTASMCISPKGGWGSSPKGGCGIPPKAGWGRVRRGR